MCLTQRRDVLNNNQTAKLNSIFLILFLYYYWYNFGVMTSIGTYDGGYLNGLFDGQGTLEIPGTVNKYVGNFSLGLFHGKGVMFVEGGKFEVILIDFYDIITTIASYIHFLQLISIFVNQFFKTFSQS